MRSPNPLVAIGITTLITVGAVHSGSAQASSSVQTPSPAEPSASEKSEQRSPRSDVPAAEATSQETPATEAAQTEATSPVAEPVAETAAKPVAESAQPGEAKTPASETSAADAADTVSQAEPSTGEADDPQTEPLPDSTPDSTPNTSETDTSDTPTADTSETSTSEMGTPTDTSETNTFETNTSETSTSETGTPEADTLTEETDTSTSSETEASDTPDTDTPDTGTPTEATPSSPSTSGRVQSPDYLNPSPNPLDFPTRPEEVELQGTQPITLRQAVDLAVRNNPQLRQARQQRDQAQAQLDQARAANNPTVSVNANLVQQGQESPVTSQQPPFTVNNQGQVVPNPNAGPGETEIQSSDAASLSGNLEVSYALFTSGRRSSLIRASEGQVRVQQLEIERQTNELILQVATAYFDLQQAGAQVRIFQSNVEQAEQSLRDAEALERAGVGTRFDVLQAQVDVANAQQNLTQQLSSFDIARRNLTQLLNTSNGVDLTAADPIEVAGDWNLSLEQSIVEALRNRAELEQQLIQREASEEQRQAALAQLGPQVNLQGSFGLNNNLDAGNGFLNNYQLGVGLSLNLYDGGAARAEARAQETNIAQAESQFESLQNQIRFETEQAYSQLQASATNIQTTALAVQQAAEALRLARLRFQAGVGTQTDVLRQQTALAQTQVNNLQAILGYNRALATLQRQVSNLPEGFIGDTP
ncbi:TolC family protein [Leptolyngbya sp. ST-U4]|uniref:TolC family protein n=1 Tax=Leptolyngbya sp. ST-U4 TaxID=2933912 RepID=UPI0019B5D659|nr:TolC family protein [Cyanobacteria bacterium FACHB-502]